MTSNSLFAFSSFLPHLGPLIPSHLILEWINDYIFSLWEIVCCTLSNVSLWNSACSGEPLCWYCFLIKRLHDSGPLKSRLACGRQILTCSEAAEWSMEGVLMTLRAHLSGPRCDASTQLSNPLMTLLLLLLSLLCSLPPRERVKLLSKHQRINIKMMIVPGHEWYDSFY